MSSTNLRVSSRLSGESVFIRWVLLVLMIGTVANADKSRFCGRQLVMTLSMLCEEFPDLHSNAKKSMIDFDKDYTTEEWMTMMGQDSDTALSTDLMLPRMDQQQQQQQVPLWMTMMYPQGYGFRSGAARNDLIPARFRKSPRGIVDECCLRPCGMNTLLKYCKTVA